MRTCVIIFTKDRPMQLQATLESFRKNVSGILDRHVYIIAKRSNSSYISGYQRVKHRFQNMNFWVESDFRKDVLHILSDTFYTHVLFSVDDTIFHRPINIHQVYESMNEERKAIGFSLRLGLNTTYCYMLNKPQKLINVQQQQNILKWKWQEQKHDYSYCLELSSSVYRTSLIRPILNELPFTNPNTLEVQMHANRDSKHPFLLSFDNSKCFSNPVNLTQIDFKNRNENGQTCDELLELFLDGNKIDLKSQYKQTLNSPHVAMKLSFIKNR